MSSAAQYNADRIIRRELTVDHITELVRFWQLAHELTPDGKAGPLTIASIAAGRGPLSIAGDWLIGAGVIRVDAHPSWYGGTMEGGFPRGIVAHYTATGPASALTMADRRGRPFDVTRDRLASWHVTIDTDGTIVQMIPFTRIAWHAGSATARDVPGLGKANHSCVGIELVGHGDAFTAAQVAGAKRVWRAVVERYAIAREYAMLEHSKIDPTRRQDPGPTWMGQYAGAVLDVAYAK
jgi:hypothetical protein